MTSFIGICSAKGGVGKTTVAINLCAALSYFGKMAHIVDANTETPHVGLYLGVAKPQTTLNDALKGIKSITEAVYVHSSGVKFVPASISYDDASVSAENLSEVFLDLYGKTDIVLVDFPAGMNSSVPAMKAVDELIIVANPDIVSVTDAIKTKRLARELGKKVRGIIVNKMKSGAMSIQNVETMLGAKVIGVIPEDANVQNSFSLKHPSVFAYPDCESSARFKQTAAFLLGQSYEPEVKTKFSFLVDKLGL